MKGKRTTTYDHINLTEYPITETYTLSEEYQEQGTVKGESFFIVDVIDEADIEITTLEELYESRVRYFIEEVVQNNEYDEDDIYHDHGAWTDDEWMVHAVDVNLYIDLDGEKFRLPCNNEYLTEAIIEREVDRNERKRILTTGA